MSADPSHDQSDVWAARVGKALAVAIVVVGVAVALTVLDWALAWDDTISVWPALWKNATLCLGAALVNEAVPDWPRHRLWFLLTGIALLAKWATL